MGGWSTSLRIWFETHATSLDSEAGLASGWFDVDLSPLGEQQARELGERRRPDTLTAVYCSDLRRAYRTAEIAFDGSSVAIRRDPRLRECDYGRLTRQPVARVDAARLDAIRQPFPGGESYEQVAARTAAWLRELGETERRGPVLVIGHRATFYAFEHLLKGVPLAEVMLRPWAWQPGWEYEVEH